SPALATCPAGSRRRRRDADDERPYERRCLRHRPPLEPSDLESLRLDGLKRRPVAIAADDEAIDSVHAVLEPREPRLVGADVLHEHEPAAWTQDTVKLAERAWLIVDPAEDESRDHGVERGVVERKVLGRSSQDLREGCMLAC